MPTALLALSALLLLAPMLLAAESAESTLATSLTPGKTLTWEFPDLPPTLREWTDGTKIIPKATVYLPADYTPDRKFPLALFVGGAMGGAGDNADMAREAFGETGFICVGLPSFKESIDPLKEDNSNYWNRMYIKPSEGPHIWRAYQVMLDKICSEIPNIDRERGVYGGFSNGAHIAAAFLSNPEEAKAFTSYFRFFVLVEGASQLKPAADLTGCHFLLMRGGASERDVLRKAKPELDAAKLPWTEFVMPDVGHEYSPEGKTQTRLWVQSMVSESR